ncbi:P-loop containing nucleoside triphosphate hydrolase protein [Leucogyrophana mollusca]|uniref:P-loop containing nucleoside triphosphate hydrolase protein n=1 Tax=Leucogyrophana mollusca TaxID=85980 RepID=A0ACB8BIF5_9AGAM|nr:P-loop containing nucleoside triphosphate hydrolase protein [Leucogyrophana mollusca]
MSNFQEGKTKAKSRYLRRKKERRKARKSAAPRKHVDQAREILVGSDDHDEADGDDAHSENDDGEVAAEVTVAPGTDVKERRTSKKEKTRDESDDKPPRKRRKVVDVESIPKDTIEIVATVDDQHLEPSQRQTPPQRSPTPQAALPSFPLPAIPDAPSKSVLAVQGLDQALLGAEVVNPAASIPIPSEGEEDTKSGLSGKTRKRLIELGITELFAVQTALLPFLLPKNYLQRSLYMPFNPPQDVCVSAPTGSGKTLAYVLPIIEILSSRIVTRLYALVVLPTRDLVTQVRETFEAVGKGRGLKIGVATGQHSFAHEQSQLVADRSSHKVDILICTPGRLIDHLTGTPNFSLQHLRFLARHIFIFASVIDEADRLLAQSFQDWLAQVLAATRPSSLHRPEILTPLSPHTPTVNANDIPFSDALAPHFLSQWKKAAFVADIDEKKESSCQKLLFSATLTRDPGRLAALDLRNPKYFVVQSRMAEDKDKEMDVITDRFTMPATLNEHMIVCESSQKPLMLFHLVQSHNVQNALVFTKSSESTTRLVRLFQSFETARAPEARHTVVQAYSSDLPAGERKGILDKFKAQEIDILVCSDLISRGIDISHVSHVVSYDVPVDMRKYVHRVGRTARAGRAGDAWTLVEEQEVALRCSGLEERILINYQARYFKSMLKASDHLGRVKRLRVVDKDVASLVGPYQASHDLWALWLGTNSRPSQTALQNLREIYTR